MDQDMESSLKKYPLMTKEEITPWVQLMKENGVSEVARSKRGFLHNYFNGGFSFLKNPSITASGGLSKTTPWWKKRENFIKRHMVQYQKHKTYRRKLAIIAWAYMPK